MTHKELCCQYLTETQEWHQVAAKVYHKILFDFETKDSKMESTGTNSKLLAVGELAEILGVSARTVWRLVSVGDLFPPLKIGGSVRWQQSKVEKWIEAGCPRTTKH